MAREGVEGEVVRRSGRREMGEGGKTTPASSDQYFNNCSSTTMMISVPEHAVPTVIGAPLARKWSCFGMVRVSLGESACETKDGVSGL